MPNRKSGIRGCIDLGSSYFRLLVVEIRTRASDAGVGKRYPESGGITVPCGRPGNDAVRVLADDRVYVGWGAALARDGLLLPREIDRAESALGELVSRASDAGCNDPSIVGTGTLRRALNRGEAVVRLKSTVSLPLTTLSQRGEAALGFLGAGSLVEGDAPALQIDVGGTSSEIAWGRGGIMEDYIGLEWGTHTVQAVMSRSGPHRSLSLLREMLFPGPSGSREPGLYGLPGVPGAATILCSGGTAVSLAVILNYTRRIEPLFREGELVSEGDLAHLLRRLWGLSDAERRRRLPLDRERVNLLLPGALLLTLLVREMRLPAFRVTMRDVRWGGIIAGDHLAEYSIDGRRDR